MTLSKIFLHLGNKVFPFLALPVLVYLWNGVGGIFFTLFALGLPFLFGYIAPGIGTNVLKMWRFRDTWTVGNYYVHHGFIYAASMGSVLYLAFNPPAQNDWGTLLGNILRCGGVLGFVGWAHDTIAIREGQMEVYNKPWKQGKPAEAIAAQYAPICFSLLGACYAGAVTLGYQTLVLSGDLTSLWWLFPLGLTLMSAAISLPFLGWIREVLSENQKSNP